MNNLKIFSPKKELEAKENLCALVNVAREELSIFGANLPFDDIAWDITEYLGIKGHGRKRVRIFFSSQATVDSSRPDQMEEPFCSFAKSYVRYMHSLRPTLNPAFRVSALRALDAALIEFGSNDPTQVNAAVLNRAAAIISESLTETTAYRVSIQLELIAKFIVENQLASMPFQWSSPTRRPSDTIKVGKIFDDERQGKLPSEAALDALPKAFHLATSFPDVLYSSVAAILCSAPDRIGELLSLPIDCEVSDSLFDGTTAYGLRWWPAKGADPMVKWIIPSMAPVVSLAISRIKEITAPAREIAQWYETNPDELYLPDGLRHFAGKESLSLAELGEILWIRPGISKPTVRQWCVSNGVSVSNGSVVMADIAQVMVKLLPEGFPYLNRATHLRYSQILCLTRKNETHSNRATYRCMIDPVTINQVNSAFGARSKFGFESIFDRLGFFEDNGEPIRVSTHQFRHYLNTLAQSGGLTQLDIAKWSGRIDIRQNNAYNHVTADQMVVKVRALIGESSSHHLPIAELPRNIPISRDEFARLKISTAHTTDFGFCLHDYTMSPCELFADCINCNEHVCVKGDQEKTEFVRRRFEESKVLLAKAELAKNNGYYGADRWMDHHQQIATRLMQLCDILKNPAIPIGSVVQLSNLPTVSRISQAMEDRGEAVVKFHRNRKSSFASTGTSKKEK
ncbi:integrase [Undibacterium danionis]|uniref:Integrase n=1 Tax=Undibacterium danionis TaxID=1812100 RepID=A0ABV6IDE9_9BURK